MHNNNKQLHDDLIHWARTFFVVHSGYEKIMSDWIFMKNDTTTNIIHMLV